MHAVHFGAGNIGRGFLGQLYFESGCHTTFVDVDDAVIHGLQARGAYPLHLVAEQTEERLIQNVHAIHAGDSGAVAEALASADIASTAVGVEVLPRLAPVIAAAVARRFATPGAPPLNIIICENLLDAGPFLRDAVRQHLDPALHPTLDEKVGFVEASVGRMVPVMSTAERDADPLLVCVEPYCELPVSADAFKGPIPDIAHMKPIKNFGAYVERKLFVHNMSHAATAYLGYLRGYAYIWQAIRDARIRTEVEKALAESCAALAAKHGLGREALDAHAADLVQRYHNKALGDQVARVARDPRRKLGHNDRLIGAARVCMEAGGVPAHIAFAAAAAILYDHPGDPAATELQRLRQDKGAGTLLKVVCGLETTDPLALLILEQLQRVDAFRSATSV